jgi:DNA topoisomerase-1
VTKLIIVASAAKAKKIAGFLGSGWRIEACLGHVRDLSESELGVEVGADFRPTYAVLHGKGNVVKKLLKAIKDAEAVYVATDPDHEGEAIAWHLLKLANIPKDKPVYRALFHAITKDAVREAIAHPRALDVNLVEAQQANFLRVACRVFACGWWSSSNAKSMVSRPKRTGRWRSN